MQEEVAREFGIPVQFQRFWLWAKRQNHTYRPNRPLTPMEETQSVNIFCLLMFLYVLCVQIFFQEFMLERLQYDIALFWRFQQWKSCKAVSFSLYYTFVFMLSSVQTCWFKLVTNILTFHILGNRYGCLFQLAEECYFTALMLVAFWIPSNSLALSLSLSLVRPHAP